jgi:Asp-tRNA(Asn)/Glu-tRNA(Gln) amidotransferase A subunit family amidase
MLGVLVGRAEPVTARPAMPLRLGLLEEYFLEDADEAIRQATMAAVERLVAGGARVRPAALSESFADVHRLHRTIMAVEVAAVHRPRFQARREAYGPAISALVDEGLAVSAVEYAEALAHQREFRRKIPAILEGHDALIMPATDTTAPRSLATTGDSKFQAPWSYAGLPAVSIPCGLAADGMPAAIQLVGRPGEDFAVLQVAQWCEERLEFRAVPPQGLGANEG